jgi:glycosyltransferase involved in cell wall biosynthesis
VKLTTLGRGSYSQRVRDEWVRLLRFPGSRPPRWPTRWVPLLELIVFRRRHPDGNEAEWQNERARTRRRADHVAQIMVAAWMGLFSWRRLWSDERLSLRYQAGGTGEQGSRRTDSRGGKRQSIRVAYVGPTPRKGAGGPEGAAWLVLQELCRSAVRMDLYLTATEDRLEIAALESLPGVKVIRVSSVWRWNRWYSRNNIVAMVTGMGSTSLGRRRLVNLLVEQHKLVPYDVMYQFSTIEVFGRRRDRQKLPTMVLHPSVHAAGELHWMWNERELSRRCEGWLRPRLVMGWFLFRSRRQRRDIGRAALVLALSDAFGRHLVGDYGIDPTRIRIAPNPIDLESFRPRLQVLPTEGPLRIAVLGRISVRKGLELVVELSSRMRDLAGLVHFEIVGDPSLWSDYRRLLDDLDPTMASIHGHVAYDELKEWIPTCDLLLQPAKYEPFGLTVGEALACGVPVVVTSEVGAGEQLSEACSIRIPPCDVEALEKAVREMVARLTSPAREPMRAAARSEAERLWSAASTTLPVIEALLRVAAPRTDVSAGPPSNEPPTPEF